MHINCLVADILDEKLTSISRYLLSKLTCTFLGELKYLILLISV